MSCFVGCIFLSSLIFRHGVPQFVFHMHMRFWMSPWYLLDRLCFRLIFEQCLSFLKKFTSIFFFKIGETNYIDNHRVYCFDWIREKKIHLHFYSQHWSNIEFKYNFHALSYRAVNRKLVEWKSSVNLTIRQR